MRVLAPPKVKFFNQSITSEEEKKEPESRPYLLVECQRLDSLLMMKQMDVLIRTLIEQKEALLTDTLAEELGRGLQIFMTNVVIDNPAYMAIFSENTDEIPTSEMIDTFLERVNSENYDDDR